MDTEHPSSSSGQPGETSAPSLSRRGFLCKSCGCVLAGQAIASRAQAAYGDPIPVGTVKDYPVDEISEKYVQYNFFVIRNKGRLFATIATCPHKGSCLFRDTANPKEIGCSGHDSVFDIEGRPLRGKVHQGLDRFRIFVDDKGTVRVDPDKKFPEEQWESQESFVPVKGKA